MANRRNLLNWLRGQRVDLGDFVAAQRNAQFNMRRSIENLVFGRNASQNTRVIGGFRITANAPADSFVNVAQGTAIGLERLGDDTLEGGVVFGADTVSSRALDFSALAVGTYSVWLRFSADPGEPGARVFYNPATAQEEGDTIDTEIVHDWDVVISASSPGDEYIELGNVDWAGATVTTADITNQPYMLFEGDPATNYAPEWGDGANDRNDDRAQYGIQSGLNQWVAAIRRQVSDIIGEVGWYSAPATDLSATAAHLADSADPHGTTLTQSILAVDSLVGPATLWLDPIDHVMEVTGGDPPRVTHRITAADLWAGRDGVTADGWTGTGATFQFTEELPTGGAETAPPNATGKLNVWIVGGSTADAITTCYVDLPITGADAADGTAELKLIRMYGHTSHANCGTVTFDILQVDYVTGAFTVLASINSGAVAASGDFVVSNAALAVALDTSLYHYVARVHFDTDGQTGEFTSIFSLRVDYERTKLFNW